MNLTSIPALRDNYVWVLHDQQRRCLLVDPGEAAPVIATLEQRQWQPVAILLTHHHDDHVGGVRQLREKWPQLAVYGPDETRNKGATCIVKDGDTLTLLQHKFSVILTAGHTLGHICWYAHPWLFCGDTLFSGGCGRLFEGSTQQMYHSLQTLAQLPNDTLICCAHEYTLANMAFAQAVMPEDATIARHHQKIKSLRAKNELTLPTTLAQEKEINLFLRLQDPDLQKALAVNAESLQP